MLNLCWHMSDQSMAVRLFNTVSTLSPFFSLSFFTNVYKVWMAHRTDHLRLFWTWNKHEKKTDQEKIGYLRNGKTWKQNFTLDMLQQSLYCSYIYFFFFYEFVRAKEKSCNLLLRIFTAGYWDWAGFKGRLVRWPVHLFSSFTNKGKKM